MGQLDNKKRVRDLEVIASGNMKGQRECNVLRIKNLDEFLAHHGDYKHIEYYASPFQVLAELEKVIKFENRPEKVIGISYKLGGDVLFNLVDISADTGARIVTYEFNGFVS